jgi:hypothetical protein
MAEAENTNLDEIESLTRVYGTINKLTGEQVRHELEKRGASLSAAETTKPTWVW